MARYPSAEWAPVAWMDALPRTHKTQLSVHITAGESDPRDIHTWRTGQAGANFVIFRNGRLIQLSDSRAKSAADFGATHTISVECVGLNGPLTLAQVVSLQKLILDAHRIDGIPLTLAATSSHAGIGWHRLGVDGNFPHGRLGGRLQRSPLGVKTSRAFGKLCPTDAVIHQIHDVVLPGVLGGAQPAPVPEPPKPDPVVLEVQGLLNEVGYVLAEDGFIGAITAGAIKHFQGRYGLDVTGEISDGLISMLRTVIRIIEDEKEEEMKGAMYRRADGTAYFIVFNEVSGFYSEHSGAGGAYNSELAQNWRTLTWPEITEGHAKELKKNLDKVRGGVV